MSIALVMILIAIAFVLVIVIILGLMWVIGAIVNPFLKNPDDNILTGGLTLLILWLITLVTFATYVSAVQLTNINI